MFFFFAFYGIIYYNHSNSFIKQRGKEVRKIVLVALCAFVFHPAFATDSTTTVFATANYVNGAVDSVNNTINETNAIVNQNTQNISDVQNAINTTVVRTGVNANQTMAGTYTITGTLNVPTPEMPDVQ